MLLCMHARYIPIIAICMICNTKYSRTNIVHRVLYMHACYISIINIGFVKTESYNIYHH